MSNSAISKLCVAGNDNGASYPRCAPESPVPIDADCSATRAMIVAESLAKNGALSLKELTQILPYHRSSIWRSIDALRKRGWIRACIGGRKYTVSGHFANDFTLSVAMKQDADILASIASNVLENGIFHVEFGCFDAPGSFLMLESSRQSFSREVRLSLTDESLAIAAQLNLPRSRLDGHLEAYQAVANAEQRLQVRSGEHMKTLQYHRIQGAVWEDDRSEVSIPLKHLTSSDCAMKISLKIPTRKNRRRLETVVKWLKGSLGQ